VVYRLAAREVELEDLNKEEQAMVKYFMSRHHDVKPGTPEYRELLNKAIQRVLRFMPPPEHSALQVLF